jgi:hypothetical protein
LNSFCEGMGFLTSLDQIPIFQKPPSNHHKECQKQPFPLTSPINRKKHTMVSKINTFNIIFLITMHQQCKNVIKKFNQISINI